MNFKKPKDLTEYISIWGFMDDVVKLTKKGKALAYWKRNSIPHTKNGMVYETLSANFGNKDGSVYRHITYDDIIVNRYWYERHFEEDMKHYKRLYFVFTETMAM